MSSRAERRQQADKKRERYKELITLRMREILRATEDVEESLMAGDLHVQKLIEKKPHEAHLIRSAAYKLKRDPEGIFSRAEKARVNP